MSVTISINDEAILEFLHGLMRKSQDLTPLMDDIGAAMDKRVSDRFETESDPMGVPWSPWAESTRKSYPENGHGRLLDRLGDMLGGRSYTADATSMTYGFDQPYAAYHEFGTKHMPRRGMLAADPEAGTLSEGDQAAVLDILLNYLSET